MATFVLDRKVLLPRMTRVFRRFDPETPVWSQLKSCVTNGLPLDWNLLAGEFRYAEMIAPASLKSATRADHMRLKGLYAFLQMAYLIVEDDRVALFKRQKHVITQGCSPLIFASAAGLQDHSAGESKLQAQIDPSVTMTKTEPFAIGFTELNEEARVPSPAYFWLIHKITLNRKLPRSRPPHTEHDSFVGMKRISSLRSGQVRVQREHVVVNRSFDTLLLNLLASTKSRLRTADSAIRLLTRAEIKSVPDRQFRVGREVLRSRLRLFSTAASLVGGAQKSEWVIEQALQLYDKLPALWARYFL